MRWAGWGTALPTIRFSRNERREPERWLVLDALAPAEATAAAVWERVARMLTGAEDGRRWP